MSELFDAIKNGDAERVKGLLEGVMKNPGPITKTNRWKQSGHAPVDCNEIDPATGERLCINF